MFGFHSFQNCITSGIVLVASVINYIGACHDLKALVFDWAGYLSQAIHMVNHTDKLKWSRRWLQLAHEVSTWSKDQTQVGAVIFDKNRNPRGFGYNGIPRGLNDATPVRLVKPLKNWYFEHAERNVIYACSRNGISCDDCTMAVTHWPCTDCTRAIIQSGIREVIVDEACLDPQGVFYQKWQDQIKESRLMLQEAGVHTQTVRMNHNPNPINKDNHSDN